MTEPRRQRRRITGCGGRYCCRVSKELHKRIAEECNAEEGTLWTLFTEFDANSNAVPPGTAAPTWLVGVWVRGTNHSGQTSNGAHAPWL